MPRLERTKWTVNILQGPQNIGSLGRKNIGISLSVRERNRPLIVLLVCTKENLSYSKVEVAQ